jgi:hypothetical protein
MPRVTQSFAKSTSFRKICAILGRTWGRTETMKTSESTRPGGMELAKCQWQAFGNPEAGGIRKGTLRVNCVTAKLSLQRSFARLINHF